MRNTNEIQSLTLKKYKVEIREKKIVKKIIILFNVCMSFVFTDLSIVNKFSINLNVEIP